VTGAASGERALEEEGEERVVELFPPPPPPPPLSRERGGKGRREGVEAIAQTAAAVCVW